MRKATRRIFTTLGIVGLVVNWAIAQDDAVPHWVFDRPEAAVELQAWGALSQLAPLLLADVADATGNLRSVLLIESLGDDPFFFPGGNWDNVNYQPFPGDVYHTLSLGIRVNLPTAWQIYYVLVDDLDWGEAKRQGFEVQGGADFQDIEVVLERGGWQNGYIKVFRIDPGATAGVAAAIDYISFTGPPGTIAVAPHATLATEWGRMKSSR